MSQEDSEMWRAHHEAQQRQRQKNRDEANDEIQELESMGYEIEEFNQGCQFRINGVLDIFPTNQRYHDLKTHQRGDYHQGKLVEFVKQKIKQK